MKICILPPKSTPHENWSRRMTTFQELLTDAIFACFKTKTKDNHLDQSKQLVIIIFPIPASYDKQVNSPRPDNKWHQHNNGKSSKTPASNDQIHQQ